MAKPKKLPKPKPAPQAPVAPLPSPAPAAVVVPQFIVSSPSRAPSVSPNIAYDARLEVYELGGFGRPSSKRVQIGTVAVATRNADPYDHDNLEEVYLAGETVSANPFRVGAQNFVALLAVKQGEIEFSATQWLAGISHMDQDRAVIEFTCDVRLKNPIKLLEQESKWTDKNQGPALLNQGVTGKINSVIASIPNDPFQLWSAPRSEDVGNTICSKLNEILAGWGLYVDRPIPYRQYPPALAEIALQFKSSERELLETKGASQSVLLRKLGLQETDLAELQSNPEKYGGGAGLFKAARKKNVDPDPFIKWLKSKQPAALAAAEYLEKIKSGGYTDQEVALSDQVLLSAFRHPVLGLGEWGDTEQILAEASQYRRMETFLQEALQRAEAAQATT
jgi:hypothetical protein